MNAEKVLRTIIKASEAKTQKEKIKILKDAGGAALCQYLQIVLDSRHTFYMTLRGLPAAKPAHARLAYNFEDMMHLLYRMKARMISGKSAEHCVATLLGNADTVVRTLFQYAIDRKLPGNIGETLVNKAFPGLIYHQPYGGVASYDPEKIHTRFDWSRPVILEEKADGLALFLGKDNNGICYAHTRQGQDIYDALGSMLIPVYACMEPGTVHHYEACLRDKADNDIPRIKANGLFNSQFQAKDGVLVFQASQLSLVLLDAVTWDGFYAGVDKTSCEERISKMAAFLRKYELSTKFCSQERPFVRLAYFLHVRSINEARDIVGRWIGNGMEGGVLKDPKAPWKDAKMTSQMKLKNEFECTLVVTGVIPHKKHPEWVGSLESASAHTQLDIQQGTPIIKTNVGSGLNEDKDSELCRTNGFDRWLGAIIEVKAECISKHNALQHPRITGIRYDKTAADTYDEVVAAYSDSIAIKENIMH